MAMEKIYFDPILKGFFSDKSDVEIPVGAVEITKEEHTFLLRQNQLGKIIEADADGNPIVVDKPLPTLEEKKKVVEKELRAFALEALITERIAASLTELAGIQDEQSLENFKKAKLK